MLRCFLESNGRVVSKVFGGIDIVSINTPSNAIHVDDIDQNTPTDYWDFDLHQFVSIGEAPMPHYVFDYSFKQWIDPRTLDDIKAQKWTSLKTQRNAFEFGGFLFDGLIYDSDQVSQARIMGAVMAQVDQVWTLANNTTVDLTASQLMQLYQALQVHIASAHERGRIAREAIQAATTKEQIEAIVF